MHPLLIPTFDTHGVASPAGSQAGVVANRAVGPAYCARGAHHYNDIAMSSNPHESLQEIYQLKAAIDAILEHGAE